MYGVTIIGVTGMVAKMLQKSKLLLCLIFMLYEVLFLTYIFLLYIIYYIFIYYIFIHYILYIIYYI